MGLKERSEICRNADSLKWNKVLGQPNAFAWKGNLRVITSVRITSSHIKQCVSHSWKKKAHCVLPQPPDTLSHKTFLNVKRVFEQKTEHLSHILRTLGCLEGYKQGFLNSEKILERVLFAMEEELVVTTQYYSEQDSVFKIMTLSLFYMTHQVM